MNAKKFGPQTRRQFLKRTTAATAAVAAASLLPTEVSAQEGARGVAIVLDPHEPIVAQTPVQWAAGQLLDALRSRGVATKICPSLAHAPATHQCVLATSPASSISRRTLDSSGASMPDVPEAIGLTRAKVDNRSVLLVCGFDVRGLVFGLLELADRVSLAADPLTELNGLKRMIEKPANVIRSVARFFTSDVEDKPWFNDRAFWERYLAMLATQRFNRFSLTLGIGYDFTTGIRDCYFHFAYPFFLSVPGYDVRAVPLPDAERGRNLEMLRFISDETARRGLHFQLGLWTHAYKWTNSPNANYTIEGLLPETQAVYCRDALQALLQACPSIGGVTFRIHGESGVPEASYDFWRTVFDGIVKCGRRVEIDMHAKGMDEAMIDVALATGMPVNISPKFWAEHLGLGYMQGAIRPLEMPRRDVKDSGFFAKSSGSRQFLRYGYGDLLREDRRYGVLHRIWPGTHRFLLWGDPQLAGDYGRAFSFCGSVGVELCEPLSFKGRKGSGLPGGRHAYADASLKPKFDFEKYAYTYRLFGRSIYNPDCDAELWRRFLRKQFGHGADQVEGALASASRILPLVTTAHGPSAANNNYWPEIYTNMPIVDARKPHPYGDTLSPKRFGTVSSFDPEFFSRIDDFADELLKSESNGKYSPVWVAEQLDGAASRAEALLASSKSKVREPKRAEFRRVAADVAIQSGLGRFFAGKLRAGVLFAIYERTGHRPALQEAIKAYRRARAAWAELAESAKGVYRSDITFGYDKHLRGHWLDRLPAIDDDIADMEELFRRWGETPGAPLKVERKTVEQAVRKVLAGPRQSPGPELTSFHLSPRSFERGKPLVIETSLATEKNASKAAAIRLRYRRVNQAEIWQVREMEASGNGYHAAIPADYTDSPFPLQYHFEIHPASGAPWLYPGLFRAGFHQPYFVVRHK